MLPTTKHKKSFASRSQNIEIYFFMIALMFLCLIVITYISLPERLHKEFSFSVIPDNNGEIIDSKEQKIINTDVISNELPSIGLPSIEERRKELDKQIKINSEKNENESDDIKNKRNAIKQTFINAYNDYKKHCWGQDELSPIGPRCHNWVDLGLTIVDAIDTMYIMNLEEMYKEAAQWIELKLTFNKDRSVSFFETTIRCLGGLMGIYDLTGNNIFLTKAKDLAGRLLPVFNTPNGLPLSQINLINGNSNAAGWTGNAVLLAEVGTVQLEFKSVADRSKDKRLGEAAVKVFDKLDPKQNGIQLPLRGQYAIFLDTNSIRFRNSHVTWGAMGDSFYEYLLKYWIYDGKKTESYRRMYIESVEGMLDHLYKKNDATGLYYIAEWKNGHLEHKMDELACFTGGTLALGIIHAAFYDEKMKIRHLNAAKELAKTCFNMFRQQRSGLAPEFVRFSNGGMSNGVDFYILRPETVETLFYLWRLTKDEIYRQWSWSIYEAIEKNCKVTTRGAGYSPILSVGGNPHQDPQGVMHSFFLAETLKYLYLTFSNDQIIKLDHFVFNTEAHPIFIP